LPDFKYFLQHGQCLSSRLSIWKGAKILPFFLFSAPMKSKSWPFLVRNKNIRVGFIISQHDVVGRMLLLNQILFKYQCFCFSCSNRHFNARNTLYKHLCLGCMGLTAKVTTYSVFKIFCLADIEDLLIFVIHLIDARTVS